MTIYYKMADSRCSRKSARLGSARVARRGVDDVHDPRTTRHIDSRPALRRSEAMRRIPDGDLVRRSSPAAKHRAYRGHHRRAVCAVFIVDLLDDLQCQVPERLLVLHAP